MAEREPHRRTDTKNPDLLNQPLDRGPSRKLHYDPERFGRLSEGVARYIGSWRFIAWMTAIILLWMAFNIFAPEAWRPDDYPFLFLVLLLSLQASYAAPLILLAQNRQADRDRVQYVEDRDRTERLVEDTEYLMREIAALRTALGEVATRDYVRGEFKELLIELPQELARQQIGPATFADSSPTEFGSKKVRKQKKTGRLDES
jgi:uncharacterized membrane protein